MQLWPEGTVAPAHGMEEIVNSAEMWITALWVLFDFSFLYASQWQSQIKYLEIAELVGALLWSVESLRNIRVFSE